MQKSFSKLKINSTSIKKIKIVWESVYKDEYDEGLRFLVLGLLNGNFDLDKVIHDIKSKKPIQYIIGEWNFYEGNYFLTEDVLIPRPETEVLVDYIKNKFLKLKTILDLGTGSGCIAIELSKIYKNSKVFGSDLCTKALRIAKKNNVQTQNKVKFIESDWFVNIKGKFDLIVSNPPYIPENAKLETSTLFEPGTALFSQDAGLRDLKKIISEALNYLKINGVLILEPWT
jgi:HemK family putative methylases